MQVLDLFAGIGGFTLGLERAGFETVAFCEIDPYAQKVLKKNWPGVPIYDDVRTITAERLVSDGISVDVITGGFPCQDISVAGHQQGIEGERSGLWSECARLLGELQPRYAIFENVTNLLNGERGAWFKRVLWDISQIGYDAEWHCIPASELGARTITEIGYGLLPTPTVATIHASMKAHRKEADRLHSKGQNTLGAEVSRMWPTPNASTGGTMSNWNRVRPSGQPAQLTLQTICENIARTTGQTLWRSEPDVGRVANGIPSRSHRLKCLGNAVVPLIPELIGRAIREAVL